MILVDLIIGHEGGAFIEMETEGLITNGALLGFVMLIPIIILWGIYVLITKPEKKQRGG